MHQQTWMPYIHCVHGDDASWFISMGSILMDTSRGLVEFLIAMTDLNKKFINLIIDLKACILIHCNFMFNVFNFGCLKIPFWECLWS